MTASSSPSPSTAIRRRTATGGSTIDGPVATLTMAVDARRRPARRLRAEAQLLRPRRRHRAARRRAAAALRAPRGAGGRRHRRPRQGVLRRRQHPDARRVDATPTRSTSASSPTRPATRSRTPRRSSRPGVDRRRQRHRGRRRLRAGPGLRRDRARRRPVVGRVAARGAAARRAARHRRADPGRRQAPRPARPRRRVRHPRRGRQGPAGASTGASSTPSPRAAASTSSSRERALARAAASDRPADGTGIALTPLDARRSTATTIALRPRRRSRIDRELGAAHITVRGPTGAAAGDAGRAARRRRRRLDRSPPPASSTTPCCTCASTSPRSAPGCCTPRATPTRVLAAEDAARATTPTTGWSARSACSGRARSSASTSRPARSSPSSSRAAASPARSPSWCSPPTASFMLDGTVAGRRPARRPTLRLTDANDGWYPMANGLSRLADAVLGPRRRARRRPAAAIGKDLLAAEAVDAGLVTFTPDDIDWDDEVRLMLEERTSFSPDALTGAGGQLPLRRARDDGDQDLRPPHGLAELDLPAPERRRARRRAAPLRHRLPPDLRPDEGLTRMTMTAVDIDAKIPNNVDLAGDRRLQRALESWQPKFIEWWRELGPVAFQDNDVYLRTAIAVGQEGWANFGHVKMPDYRWGIFLAEPEPDRRIAFGDHLGEPVWQEVPGEYRADLRRLLVVQGDTEPASVEQQRHAVPHRAEPLRPAQPVPGQRRGGPPPVGDGVPAAPLLRPRRPRRGRRDARAPLRRRSTTRASSAPSTSRRPTGCRSSSSPTSPTATASSSWPRCARARFDPLSRTCDFMLKEEAHHMFVGRHRRRPGRAAHGRADEGARHRRRRARTAASTSPRCSATSTSTTACRSTCSAPRRRRTPPTTSPPG